MKIVGVALLCSLMSSTVFSGACEVPKEEMDVEGISLGKPVVELMRFHKGVSLQKEWSDIDNKYLEISESAESDWVHFSPLSSLGYISYSEKDYKVNGFTVRLNFMNTEPDKIKEVSIILFDLPKNGWKKKIEDDPKYGQLFTYTYVCGDYKIRLSDSSYGVFLVFNPVEDEAP